MVDRYDEYPNGNGTHGMCKMESGEGGSWVKHEDHVNEIKALKKSLKKQADELTAANQIIQSQSQVMQEQSARIKELSK